jgi:hypothetical protein
MTTSLAPGADSFLADLLAGVGDATPRPDLDTYYAACAAHRAAVAAVGMARGALAVARSTYGYGRRADAAARELRAALARLDATPDPGPVDPDGV